MDTVMGVKALIQKDQQVLILVKPDNELDLPGGRVEWGETPAEALIREIWEETGLMVRIQALALHWRFTNDSGRLVTGVTYRCIYSRGSVRLSPEHTYYRWTDLAGLSHSDVRLKRFLCGKSDTIKQPSL